jgi:hypothetical protein
VNAIPEDKDFLGYSVAQVKESFFDLIRQNALQPIPDMVDANYFLTNKGKAAFLLERQTKEDRIYLEELQKSVSESVINTNVSVIDTNESVRQANSSVQQLNRITNSNFTVQNRLTRSSIIVAASAVFIALISLLQGILSQGNPELQKQLRETNKHLQEQNASLNQILQKQARMDSILATKISATPSRK